MKEWWSKVTNSRYEKFIPWSGISKIDGRGFDPKLNDQVIIRIFNFNEHYGHRLHKIGEIIGYGPNVDNYFRLDLEFINSNRCGRLAIIEDKIEQYHNDLNIEMYEKEENFIAGEAWFEGFGFTNEWSYTKETCEMVTGEYMHERNGPEIPELNFSPAWSPMIQISGLQESFSSDWWTFLYERRSFHVQAGYYFCESSDGSIFILG